MTVQAVAPVATLTELAAVAVEREQAVTRTRDLIRRAVAEGATISAVARAAGYTRVGVRKLLAS